MTDHVQNLLREGAQETDATLERLLPGPDVPPHSLHRAMRHSTFAGGKRLRPILCMEAARMIGGTRDLPRGATELGAAIEMIHTYSLIHDDLPALDNDDMRRGQPTCHKVFGEAIAILAGDALQTLAFQVVGTLPIPAISAIAILREISAAIGTGLGASPETSELPASADNLQARAPGGLPPGMIGGQVVDIESEGEVPTAALVEQIHRAKTGALITVSIVAGGMLGGASLGSISSDTIQRLRTFGQNAGLAFQIVDDVLDLTEDSAQLGKTAGKDAASTKATWPAVYGIEQSLEDARRLIEDAFEAIAPFGEAASNFKALATYLVDRRN